MKILIVGVGKSKNVGDQLIAACIGETFKNKYRTVELQYYDFNFGTYEVKIGFGAAERTTDAQVYMLAAEKKMSYWPRALKNLLVFLYRYRSNYCAVKQVVKDADLVVVGGGHLFIDNFLNFPLQLFLLSKAGNNKRKVYWCVGSSQRKSFLAKWILRNAIGNDSVFTRDESSRDYLITQGVATAAQVKSLCDPAIFTCDLYQENMKLKRASQRSGVKVLGLAVMDPIEAWRHSHLTITRKRAGKFWASIANAVSPEFELHIMSNGNESDQAFIEQYLIPSVHRPVNVIQPPTGCNGLISQISECDVLIGQRLHAVLPAISLGVPTMAVKWDHKVESIVSALGCSQLLCTFDDCPEDIVSKAEAMVDDILEAPKLEELKALYYQELALKI
ncbi:hypothetical protein MFKK_33460 [Halopseudomonas aestusnigri]|uniref:polysaccharide pyruvyl transferase family protein n=1 Tax=Halopseudomonas TaxID=2901189 RepID=UPI0022B707DB|nr:MULTISPECIES: polysaccharide pyruvyl transferase family protein [Halopseudomonas]BDX20536.1 hypothetical protein MFKK_33460 [Halopseudomonas aestusnigri]